MIGISLVLFAVMQNLSGGGTVASTMQAEARTALGAAAARTQILRTGDPRAHGMSDADLRSLRAILRKAVDDQTVPGVSLLVAHRGEVIFKEAFGNLTVDQKVQMASSAKPVTATLLAVLADQKRLSLDDPIENYLPEFKGSTIKGKPPLRLPTVRHLLCNMSGLPGDLVAESMLRRLRNSAGKDQNDTKRNDAANGSANGNLLASRYRSLNESVRALAKAGLATEPGAEFHYCTMGFNIAARVAEIATGRPFEELVRIELLEPMGMTSTRYIPMGLQALRADPKLPNGESRFIMAGGGMTSTLDDFAAFYQMHANGGTYRDRRFLSEQAVTVMHTRQAKLELLMAGPYGNDYGLAFFLDRLDADGQAQVISHPGLFGTTPWLDKDSEVIGIMFVQSNFLRTIPLVRELQAKVREIFPPAKQSRH
jgi:CubicO group peptidase (beta-lactamase class C family)